MKLTEDQNQTIETLEGMKEDLYSQISTLQDQIDTINGTIARFQTQILMSQNKTNWKLPAND